MFSCLYFPISRSSFLSDGLFFLISRSAFLSDGLSFSITMASLLSDGLFFLSGSLFISISKTAFYPASGFCPAKW